MSESEAPKSPAGSAESSKRPGGRRRGRRGGRGRNRGPRAPQALAAELAAETPGTPAPGETTDFATAGSPPEVAPETESEETAPRAVKVSEPPPLIERVKKLADRVSSRPPERPAEASAVSQAVNEVMQIVESLKKAVEQMEEVLELVELAERQKLADEREIDALRHALRQLHHPREGGRRERR